MSIIRSLLTGTTLLALLSGCDRPASSGAPAAVIEVPQPPRVLPPDSATSALAGVFQAAGLNIPPVSAFANRPWGQLAGFKVPAQDAPKEWERLRAATDKTGYYPLITSNTHAFLTHIDEAAEQTALEDMLKNAATIDPVAWVNDREKESLSFNPNDKAPRGPWKEVRPHAELQSLRDHRDQWEPDVYILLLPTREPWQAFLYLGWGGWNDCPEAAVHAAFFRRWQTLYGAEPMLISSDIIESRAGRPPQSKDDALALAREQYHYCSDIVLQGVGTLEALGAGLKGGEYWYFWWD